MKNRLSIQHYLFAIILLVAVSACSTADNSEPPAPLTEITRADNVQQLWTRDSGEGIALGFARLEPLIDGDTIYTIDTLGLIRSINANSGKINWEFDSGLHASSGLTGSQNLILATSRNGEVVLYEISRNTLEFKWKKELNSEILSSAVLHGKQVFVRTVDGKLIALNADNGQEQWTVSRRVPALSLTGNSSPVVTDNLVISGFDNGKLVAFDRAQGSTIWEATVATPRGRTEIERLVDLDGQFLLRDGVIYISSYQGNLVAVTVSNGQVIWSRKFSSYQAIEADQDALYLTDDRSHLWSIDRRTGSAFWSQDVLNARKITAPRLIGDRLVVGDLEGYVHWFDKQDGSLRARIETDGKRYLSQPAVQDNKVIVIDSTGQLAALALKP